jgi:hypothetical protein
VGGQKRQHAVFDGSGPPRAESSMSNKRQRLDRSRCVSKMYGSLASLADILQLQIVGTLCVLTFALFMVEAI